MHSLPICWADVLHNNNSDACRLYLLILKHHNHCSFVSSPLVFSDRFHPDSCRPVWSHFSFTSDFAILCLKTHFFRVDVDFNLLSQDTIFRRPPTSTLFFFFPFSDLFSEPYGPIINSVICSYPLAPSPNQKLACVRLIMDLPSAAEANSNSQCSLLVYRLVHAPVICCDSMSCAKAGFESQTLWEVIAPH